MKTQSLPSWRLLAGRLAACAVLAAVALLPAGAGAQTPETSTNAPTPIAFERAVLQAANEVFTKASQEGAPERIELAIDPLIDSDTGAQSNATRLEARLIADLVRRSYRRFMIVPFTTTSVSKSPYLLIGTLTHLNNAGTAGGRKDAYRVWLTLMDLKSNRIVAKSQARALPTGVDPLPTAFFADSPVFANDPATEAYIQTCHHTKVGDSIPDAYAQRVHVAAQTSNAAEAYDGRRYQTALGLYEEARHMPGGEQLRVLNGLYLANLKLNKRDAAAAAFGDVVDFGLQRERLAAKFLFRPGSTQFVARPAHQRPVFDVAAADRQAHGQGEPVPRDRGAHEPDRLGRPQRSAFQAARRGHPQAPGGRGVRARLAIGRQGCGLSREHRRDRPGRCQRCARPPR